MPQMAPLMWTSLFFYPLILVLLTLVSLNFLFKFKESSPLKSVNNHKKNFIWHW